MIIATVARVESGKFKRLASLSQLVLMTSRLWVGMVPMKAIATEGT